MLFLPNTFFGEVIRDGKVINRLKGHNLVTTEGKNHVLDVVFGGTAKTAPWYIGLVDNSPIPAFSADDTLASHAGWAIASDVSTERLEWVDADAASGSKGTTTTASFSITGNFTVAGLFIANVSSGTSGVLFNAGAFDATQDLISGETFRVGFTINA